MTLLAETTISWPQAAESIATLALLAWVAWLAMRD